jgi:hypothetical protein
MKTNLFVRSFAIAGLLGGLLGSVPAHAASVDVAIPFEFMAGDKMLPAGSYTISVDSSNILVIQGTASVAHMSLITTPESSDSTKASAVFDQGTGKASLTKVNMASGMSYVLFSPKRPAVTAAGAPPRDVLLSRH